MTNTAGVVDADHEAACHGTIRWWEPLFVVPVVACLSWLIVSCSLGFIVGALFAARGYDYTEVTAFESKVSTKFLVIQISMTIFYLAALFAIRHVLRKHRGRAWFAGYFRPIGIRPVLQAMLSGLVLAGVFLLAIVGLSQTPLWDLDPAAVNVTL
jgi:hypothetical protein